MVTQFNISTDHLLKIFLLLPVQSVKRTNKEMFSALRRLAPSVRILRTQRVANFATENTALSDYVFSTKYAKVLPYGANSSRLENWTECIDRVIGMYSEQYKQHPEVLNELKRITPLLYQKKILPAGRVLQFAGQAILLNNMKGFNCTYVAIDEPRKIWEGMYNLLCGAGVGISVRKAHISKLPRVNFHGGKEKFVIPDTIEGWAESARCLTNAAFGLGPIPEFDFSKIRPKGSPLVVSGGIAPGPEPLRIALIQAEKIFRSKQGDQLGSDDILDLMTTLSGAVVSGGVRRSSMICLFDKDDKAMLAVKTGEWWKTHPNRALCNNSVVFHPSQKSEVYAFIEEHPSIFEYGEPGIIFRNSLDYGTNPCAETALMDETSCCLSDTILPNLTPRQFPEAARAAAFLGTLSAGMTNFPFLSKSWKRSMDRDALIGVSLNGIAAVDYEQYNLAGVAQQVVEENKFWANVININTAARCTLTKPSGTLGLLAGVPAGVHDWFAKYAIRGCVEARNTPTAKYFMENFPDAIEPHLTNPDNNIFIKFPYKASNNRTRHAPVEEFLNRVAYVQKTWVLNGHNRGEDCHSVSATVNFSKSDIPFIKKWLVDHSEIVGGVSFIQHNPAVSYKQAPFTEVNKKEYEKLAKYMKTVDFSKVHGKNLTRVIESQCESGRCEAQLNLDRKRD